MLGPARLRGYVDIAFVLLSGGWSDRDALRRYQDRRLRALVEQAFRVPFHRRRFEAAGVRPGDVQSVDDLSKLPFCSRSDLNESVVSDLVDPGVDPARLHQHSTSRSTGEPVTVRQSTLESLFLTAVSLKAFMSAGAGVMDRRAILALDRGDAAGPSPWAQRGLYPWEIIHALIPPRRLAEILAAKRPEIIVGFPGLLAEVAPEMAAEGSKGYRPRFVAMAGETITASFAEPSKRDSAVPRAPSTEAMNTP